MKEIQTGIAYSNMEYRRDVVLFTSTIITKNSCNRAMSFMSLPLYPAAFPITINNKWRFRQVVTGSSSTSSHIQTKTQTSRSSSIAPLSTKLNVTRIGSHQSMTPKFATRAASPAVAVPTVPTETSMSEFEKMRNGGFWFRKWHMMDVTHLCLGIGKHGLAACAPFVLNWGAVWVAAVLSVLTGIGVTLGYHRLLTHRSFKLPKWLEYCFTYCGCHAGQRDPIFWVSVHKNHHKYTDAERDPHSPHEGFWFSHIGWFHYNEYLAVKCGEPGIGEYSNVPELKAQWFYRFLHDTYVWHTIGLGAILYMLGGFPYVAWGMGVRTVLVNHVTFVVGSVCHLWGDRPWNTPDTSTNNGIMAMLTFGEGWHNNHHAFPASARHGLEWWQLDVTWEVIKFLEMVGLATDVKLPTEAEKKIMKLYLDNSK
ncbi:hypothetical protein L1987_22818 [Smallanthus sonchifolius]|uniref:Uncharacterized protein n=1 Tax=Smallanthus sonchifolius TaxID=185202 RepID=A0ACB9IHN6_9ASTR|nr:hypothetical protein L1987_22818 [Smallanthus sonchifolius]